MKISPSAKFFFQFHLPTGINVPVTNHDTQMEGISLALLYTGAGYVPLFFRVWHRKHLNPEVQAFYD
jgi:hypothetical protein